jgi:hypothetical protein
MVESRHIAWPAYLVSIALFLLPLADVSTTLYPWRLFEPRWRFGAVGLVSNALLLPIVGLLIAFVTTALLDHRIVRRVLGVLSFLGSALCLVALVIFALDALQTRAVVREDMQQSFNVASIAAGVKTLFAGVTFFVIGLSAFRMGRGRTSDSKQRAPIFKVPTSQSAASEGARP